MTERQFTGRHALMLFVAAFGVIIAVNIALAVSAVKTFPGLEVKNSYVASQEFNTKLAAQQGLGWDVGVKATGGLLILSINDADGRPVELKSLQATLGRATHVKDDFTPAFDFDGTAYVAPAELAPGNWNLRMVAVAPDGTEFSQRIVLYVKG